MRDYQLVSPSLDGLLHHDSIVYEGIRRPEALLRIMDRRPPDRSGKSEKYDASQRKIIEQYFEDICVLFTKKLNGFMSDPEVSPDNGLKLQALLQEMIKIKKLKSKI